MIEGILSFMFALGLAQPVGSSSLSTPWALALVVAVLVVLHRCHHWLADWVIQRRARRVWWRLSVPVIQLYVFWFLQDAGWSAVVARSVGDGPLPLAYGLALLPWIVLHLSWLTARRRIEVASRRKSWPLVSYLLFHVRIWVIPLTPVLLTGGVGLVAGSFPAFRTAIASYPSLSVIGSLLLIGTLFSCSPFLARMAVPTHSLPQGALRTSLEEVAYDAGFRFLDIRVCETRNHVANAAFLGVLGRLRYVIITDGLLQRLSREQMTGVFAHEVGHSKRQHVLLNLCMIASFTVFTALIAQGIDAQSILAVLPLLLGFPAFLILVYAPIARRFESEADLFAATTLGTPGPIVDSLTALGRLYPHRRQHGGLVHPGLDERVSFIERATSDEAERAAFEGRMSALKRRICLVAVLPLVWLAVQLPDELAAGDLRYAVLEASRMEDEEAALLCIERLQDWSESGGADPGFELGMWSWQTLAIARQQRGDFEAAAEAVEAIATHRHKLQSVVLRYNSAVISAQQAAAIADWPALDREVSLARKFLQELVPLFGERDEQIMRERQDVLFLIEGRNRLRAWGILHGDADRPGGELKDVAAAFLRALDRGQSQVSEERLNPPWKQAFREHLETAQRP